MTKVKYCSECGKKTVHKLVGHELIAEGTGIARTYTRIVKKKEHVGCKSQPT